MNSICLRIKHCQEKGVPMATVSRRTNASISLDVSLGHNLCAVKREATRSNLKCAFNTTGEVKEIIMLR